MQPESSGCHRPMISSASYKYVMFHLPKTSSGTGPTTRYSCRVEAGKEAVRRSPKHFCCGCDRERTAKDKAKDRQRQSVSVSPHAGLLKRTHQYTETGRCNDPICGASCGSRASFPGPEFSRFSVIVSRSGSLKGFAARVAVQPCRKNLAPVNGIGDFA